MKNLYTPTSIITLVNVTSRSAFYSIKTAIHNVPTVTLFFGRIGTRGSSKAFTFDSRDEARKFAAAKLEDKMARGYVVVA
jgi:predicted DNA-binding WGR domain protein